jgi:hypothetical protein
MLTNHVALMQQTSAKYEIKVPRPCAMMSPGGGVLGL